MSEYQLPELYDGLRLHQNENTGGCSPRVLEALGRIGPEQIAFYPPYSAVTRQIAGYLGVPVDRIVLTNGLDEGIMALAMSCLRPSPGGPVLEAILPEPAFEIFKLDTDVAGGRLVPVMPKPDFSFALDEVLAAMTPNTRIVYVTSPNNPTGIAVPLEAIRTIARRAPTSAIVFVDEAYADFSDETFLAELPAFPNVIVGRTFSKAFGLAGLRIGCLVGAPEALARVRPALPVYSVNAAAVIAVQAALADLDYLEGYKRQVAESKALMYATCERLGLAFWKSATNFVLVRIGDRAGAFVAGLEAHGVFVRDRSSEPGCAGCVRITTGLVEHTKRCVDVMEEILCGAR